MQDGHIVPLFDPKAQPAHWNERMRPGDFAVLFANRQPAAIDPALGPVAVIFDTLAGARQYAVTETLKEPHLRCSIYTEQGLALPPLQVIAGAKGADRSFLSSRFRLWAGGICLGVGAALGVAELASGMQLNWAGMLGSRIGPAGVLLLLTELGVRLSARQRKPPSE